MNEYAPEGRLLNLEENRRAQSSPRLLREAMREGRMLEAPAVFCDSRHNLGVELGCMKGIIPREEGALGIRDGSVRDIAVISRVNRPVRFIVEEIRKDESGREYAVLSREKAQRKCLEARVAFLRSGDIVDARITHLESFGAFADIGCGIVALMPIDAISISRIEHPKERFTVGMDIKAIIKHIENGRISLSHKELLGTWEQNAARFQAGETVSGTVRSVENYGAFVELAPNLAGLAESKDGVRMGQQASVYIKSILPDRMKIKLIIIDTFDHRREPAPPDYFITEGHIDRFLYSPVNCSKVIESSFE